MPLDSIVYIVDDDAAVRQSLMRLLNAAGLPTNTYSTPMGFLEDAPGLAGGCVLLDLRMPGMDGLQVQAELHRMAIHLPVVVMTGHGDVQTAVRAMKAGAVDFIEKPFEDHVLLSAIEGALEQGVAGKWDQEVEGAAKRIRMLSPRERQVLDALVAGHPNKVIAYDLGISVRTVEVHRARMLDRLGVRQLAEAIRVAVMAQLAQ
jgi:two-component system, LuxR family, response regulator FixJ